MTYKQYYGFTDLGYEKAQGIVDEINRMGGKARIGVTWQDYGAGIKWETILAYYRGLDMDCQMLDPRDFDELNDGIISEERIQEIIKNATK